MAEGMCGRFDHHAASLGEHNIWDVYREMRTSCPVAHSDQHHGFWVLTRYEDGLAAIRDHGTFSSAHGVRIPEAGRALPIDFDPARALRLPRALHGGRYGAADPGTDAVHSGPGQ